MERECLFREAGYTWVVGVYLLILLRAIFFLMESRRSSMVETSWAMMGLCLRRVRDYCSARTGSEECWAGLSLMSVMSWSRWGVIEEEDIFLGRDWCLLECRLIWEDILIISIKIIIKYIPLTHAQQNSPCILIAPSGQ